MINYYINPKTRDLIINDGNELFIVERIEKVRVMTGSDIRLDHFDGENPDDTVDKIKAKPYQNHYVERGRAKRKPGKSKSKLPISADTISRIRQLAAAGNSASDISRQIGVAYGTARKYSQGVSASEPEQSESDIEQPVYAKDINVQESEVAPD